MIKSKINIFLFPVFLLFCVIGASSCDNWERYVVYIENQTPYDMTISLSEECGCFCEYKGEMINLKEQSGKVRVESGKTILWGYVGAMHYITDIDDSGFNPLWYYIESITIGDTELDSSVWRNRELWKCYYKDYEARYTLTVDERLLDINKD